MTALLARLRKALGGILEWVETVLVWVGTVFLVLFGIWSGLLWFAEEGGPRSVFYDAWALFTDSEFYVTPFGIVYQLGFVGAVALIAKKIFGAISWLLFGDEESGDPVPGTAKFEKNMDLRIHRGDIFPKL